MLLMMILMPALNMKIFLPLSRMMQDQNLLVTMICNNYLSFCEINEVLTFHLYKSKHTYVWPMCYLSVILLFPPKQKYRNNGSSSFSHSIVWPKKVHFKAKIDIFFIFYVTQLFSIVWMLQCAEALILCFLYLVQIFGGYIEKSQTSYLLFDSAGCL